ncbi:hypothetical protein BT96DRAFT_923360 [Gymnopus androsaceus JB14]|uniref:Fucose-specific lectin n=1 Tax=Gymnopus androsaceus JB14 TaxID=1447944 RepID=A0A6A4HA96_9AGAR|nr:hypothetical protein BT96DRAFT_923360 [Gymnopus androsaceus JB14]
MVFISKLLLTLPFASVALAAYTRATSSTNAVIPISGTNMGAIAPLPDGATWFFYQDTSNNSIIAVHISNALAAGGTLVSEQIFVPGSEVRSYSPIAVSGAVDSAGTGWQEIHVFFYSPDNVLSEYYNIHEVGVQGGPTCTTCVTNEGFVGAPDSQMLYTIETDTEVRVGFVSAGAPDTVSEAANSGNGWSVASLT